jgi:hypothetical protein
MVQVAERLPGKPRPLRSNPSTTGRKSQKTLGRVSPSILWQGLRMTRKFWHHILTYRLRKCPLHSALWRESREGGSSTAQVQIQKS